MEITASSVKELREKTGAGMMECKKALTECQGDHEKATLWLRERGMAQVAKRAGRAANQGAVVCVVKGAAAAMLELNCETDFVAKTDDFKALSGDLAVQAAEKAPAGSARDALLSQPLSKDPGKTVATHMTEVTAKLGENLVLKRVEKAELSGAGLFGSYVHGGKVGVLVEVACDAAAASKPEALEVAKEMAMQVAASSPRYVTSSEVPAEELERERAVYLAEAKQAGKPENIQAKIAEGKLQAYFKQVCLVDQPYIREPKKAVKEVLKEAASKLGGAVAVKRFWRMQLGGE
jgi:elongation factor Ts